MAEREELDWNQSLIVVARDNDVELAPGGAHKDCVGRERSTDVDAVASSRLNRGRDAVPLLDPEQTVFAGVRIEPGDRKTWFRDSEPRHGGRCDANRVKHPAGRQ